MATWKERYHQLLDQHNHDKVVLNQELGVRHDKIVALKNAIRRILMVSTCYVQLLRLSKNLSTSALEQLVDSEYVKIKDEIERLFYPEQVL